MFPLIVVRSFIKHFQPMEEWYHSSGCHQQITEISMRSSSSPNNKREELIILIKRSDRLNIKSHIGATNIQFYLTEERRPSGT